MSDTSIDKGSSLSQAIGFMRANRPLRAEELCRDYLGQKPGCTEHLRLLGHALMKQSRLQEAEQQLRLALSLEPEFPQVHEDLGSVLAMQSRFEEAIVELERAIQLQPALPLAHKKLGQALQAVGRGNDADEAFRVYLDNDPDRQAIAEHVKQLREGSREEAIKGLRVVLKRNPDSVNAMRFLALAYWQGKENLGDAEALLRRATQQAPDYAGAWLILGALLLERHKHMEAISAYQEVVRLEPENAEAWGGLGNAYSVAMYPDKGAEAFAKSVAIKGDAPGVQMGYAHVLKTLGDQAGALAAYRAAIKAKPGFGEVYWSMANLKIFNFEELEVSAMLQQIEREDLSESADIHFRFALGKAFEDKKDYDRAWHYYHTGNERQRMTVSHDPVEMENRHKRLRSVFTREFLTEKANRGHDVPDPIFIVGLPRSGSTLVEQILASHSQVEGTSELPVLGKLAESIGRYRTDGVQYPEAARDLRKKDWRAYGQQYMEESQRHRVTDKPFFTDKLPNNFPQVGLLHLILPNAKIINARRHPFDSCLGGYKQLFGSGQNFTYDMLDLAHYYRRYDAMMKHWREVLPGKVLDVHYEETVTDLENQVRRILAHCGLGFEESCVRFHETERAVKTASSEQVRQPIYTGALGTWRRYARHLDLWQEELGYIIDELPEVSRSAGL
ncbi:MAG: tetratricopeptide repeat protein [Halieaceae bacterium]|jgi:tetratricopeptide (TPR) repeat protein|nr:tetratricopeptide repeat protein [Halieaceae bacterium]